MEIWKSESFNKVEQTQKKKDFISNILDEIFLICKEDKNFFDIRKKIELGEKEELFLKSKTLKQDDLLRQSKELKDRLNSKIKEFNKSNFETQLSLLEKLGSEL